MSANSVPCPSDCAITAPHQHIVGHVGPLSDLLESPSALALAQGLNPFEATLGQLAAEVREVNTANGWFEMDRTPDEDEVLLHSEVSEALEAIREHGLKDMTEVDHHHVLDGVLPKPEGVGSELADILIRLLDTIDRQEHWVPWLESRLDIVAPIFYGEDMSHAALLNQLHKIIAAGKYGKLLHALLGVARSMDINLAAEYGRKIAFNRTRGYKHGGKSI